MLKQTPDQFGFRFFLLCYSTDQRKVERHRWLSFLQDVSSTTFMLKRGAPWQATCIFLSRTWFNLTLFVVLILWLVGSYLSRFIYKLGVFRLRFSEDASIAVGSLCAKLFFRLNPQVRTVHVGGGPNWSLEAYTQPRMLMMNHSSFLDFFLFSSLMNPIMAFAMHPRCIIAEKLTRLPFFGKGVGEYSGSFPVYFKATNGGISGGEGDSFSVDKEKQQLDAERMRAHVVTGGSLVICPEGTVNASPPGLQTFRNGSFKLAIELGMEIWGVVFLGAHECWPKKKGLGGVPCTVLVSDFRHLLTPTADMNVEAVSAECRCVPTFPAFLFPRR